MNSVPSLNGFSIIQQEWFAENVPLSQIAKEFGTPTYVYSRKALTDAFNAYEKACFKPNGERRAQVHYAMKANSNLAVIDCFKKTHAYFIAFAIIANHFHECICARHVEVHAAVVAYRYFHS